MCFLKFEMAKWPWRSSSITPIFNTSWENTKMHFGTNLVIVAQIYEKLLQRQAKFPRSLSQNGQNDLDRWSDEPIPIALPPPIWVYWKSFDIDHLRYQGYLVILTHWGWDKMAAVSQTTLSNAFSWMIMLEFRLRFHWNLFLRVQLTIIQH